VVLLCVSATSSLEPPFRIPQPVGAALDVGHMASVKEAVEKRRGHDLIRGQDLGPAVDRFVRRDQDAPPAIAVAHRPRPECGTRVNQGLQSVARR